MSKFYMPEEWLKPCYMVSPEHHSFTAKDYEITENKWVNVPVGFLSCGEVAYIKLNGNFDLFIPDKSLDVALDVKLVRPDFLRLFNLGPYRLIFEEDQFLGLTKRKKWYNFFL